MIVSLIVKLLRDCLGSLLVKVKNAKPFLSHSLSFASLLFVFLIRFFRLNFLGLLYTVTTVESGTRALQYLGLDDGDKASSGLKVLHSFLQISLYSDKKKTLKIETSSVLLSFFFPGKKDYLLAVSCQN